MIRRPPVSTPLYSSAASDVYKRQVRISEGCYHLPRTHWPKHVHGTHPVAERRRKQPGQPKIWKPADMIRVQVGEDDRGESAHRDMKLPESDVHAASAVD